MNSHKLIVENMDNAANKLVNFLCDNTAQLKAALATSKEKYVPFSSVLSYLNLANYPRWISRTHTPEYDALQKTLTENEEQKKLITLNALKVFFDKTPAWTTTSASYTLFNDLVDVAFTSEQRELLTEKLFEKFKNLFLQSLDKQIETQKKVQVPTLPIGIPDKTSTNMAARFLNSIKEKEKEKVEQQPVPGKLKNNEQHRQTSNQLSASFKTRGILLNATTNSSQVKLSKKEQDKNVQSFKI